MHKFNWFEQRGIDGTPLPRTLRSLLTNNLCNLLPKTRVATSIIFDNMFNLHENKKPLVSEMIREAVAHSNALAFFGANLGM